MHCPGVLIRGPVLGLILFFGGAVLAQTECIGDGAYRVCTTTTQRPDGSMTITSTDNMGNSYSVSSEIDYNASGGATITSRDSTGNSYEIRSWNDASGSHSMDSEGNRCSILRTGQTVGCN